MPERGLIVADAKLEHGQRDRGEANHEPVPCLGSLAQARRSKRTECWFPSAPGEYSQLADPGSEIGCDPRRRDQFSRLGVFSLSGGKAARERLE